MEFLQSEFGVVLIAIIMGAAAAIVSQLTWKAASSPSVEKFKKAYPVFNLVMSIAADTLRGTRAGLAFEVAYRLWQGQGLSPSEARRYANAMIKEFDLDRYIGTNFDQLSEAQIKQGETIAAELIKGYIPHKLQAN